MQRAISTNLAYISNGSLQALKDACEDLFARQFSYQEINERGNTENVSF